MTWPDILEAVWADDAEADEEHVGVGVGDRPQSVVILLARRVKQREAVRDSTENRNVPYNGDNTIDHLLLDHDVDGVGVEHCGHVLLRELVVCVGPQQTGFTHSPITNLRYELYKIAILGFLKLTTTHFIACIFSFLHKFNKWDHFLFSQTMTQIHGIIVTLRVLEFLSR